MKNHKKLNIRLESDFGNHPLDFQHKCCFKEQILHIGEGTMYGHGELVKVKMSSGKIAKYHLYADRHCYVFENTGLKDWKYLFSYYE